MGSSKHRIIQSNCRGIRPRYEELLLLLTLLRPSVFCLQETFLKPDNNFTFKGLTTYNHIHSDCRRASGVFQKPRRIQRKVPHGIMMTVRKLLKKENKLYLSSANSQQVII